MSFTDELTNQTQTNNGALAYKSTQSKVLDLFANGVSSKSKLPFIQAAIKEDPRLALKVALYLRDVRAGQGNKDMLRTLYDLLINAQAKETLKLIAKHTPEIGRWKDLIEQIGKYAPLDKKILKMIKKGLKAEDALLAKWLPRQGAKAKVIAEYLGLNHGDYRRLIVSLSKTVEQQMCKKQWSEINYSAVPSIANKKLAKAFLRNDSARRTKFLEAAQKGEVKMNASVLYPHEIANMCTAKTMWSTSFASNPTADALWKNLPNYMEEAVNVLPIIDLSGSMTTKAVGTEGSCMSVAIGLGLYFAEHNTGSYKDLWMNFSTNPHAYKLKGDTLSERMQNLDTNSWGGSTDINKAMSFVLAAAQKAPHEAPKMILIVSDMEFNGCVRQSNMDYFKQQFAALNVEMPTIVFWRVNTSSGSNPVTMNEKGAVIINGYSPSVLKYILSGDIANYTPYNAMLEIVEPMYPWLDDV